MNAHRRLRYLHLFSGPEDRPDGLKADLLGVDVGHLLPLGAGVGMQMPDVIFENLDVKRG